MKFLLTGIMLLCCFHSTVSADSFTIGDKKIEVPAPAGYARVTPEMGDAYRVARNLADPANDLLAYYIPESAVAALDPHYDVPNAMAFSMFVTYNVSAAGENLDDVVCCTTTFLDTDGKVLFLYCYAPQDELSWTQNAGKDWAESVMASNPKPPTGTVEGGGFRKYRGMVKWIIAGVVFLLISVFKGRGSKSA